ncbi:MAG: hypothetical protein PVI21_00080 [Candidatus Woesebacteria bacterium]|jgi:hypothetical protein
MIRALKKVSNKAFLSVCNLSRKSKLPALLCIVIIFATVTTVVSVAIYSADGTYKLDLSRPGFEHEREEVKASESQKTYDTTGAVTPTSITEFLTEYDQRTSDLTEYGNFNDQSLDNSDIQLFAN